MDSSKETQKQGEELNQLSRLMFGRAAKLWAWSLALETIGGVVAILVSVVNLSPNAKHVTALTVFGILVTSYILKIVFSYQYDNAETMRRQSILAEALDWPIGATQFSDWRLKAGHKLLKKFKLKPRDENYYSTQQPTGPRRLLEMTIESAFFTRHLYGKIRKFVWTVCGLLGLFFILVLSFMPIDVISTQTRLEIVYLLYLSLPLLISLDLFGWGLRVARLERSIKEIECDLEKLESESEPGVVHVMRLVSEYNCQVIGGFPILDSFFRRWHDEIQELWNKRPKAKWK